MLGATQRRTFFKVILPELRPALLTGFGLAFARGIGEYGSVIYISGNSAKEQTQVISYVIMQKLSYIDYASATAIALVMLVICDQHSTVKAVQENKPIIDEETSSTSTAAGRNERKHSMTGMQKGCMYLKTKITNERRSHDE